MIRSVITLILFVLTGQLAAEDPYVQRADRLMQEGLSLDAIPLYQEAMNRSKEDKTIALKLAKALYKEGRYKEVVAVLPSQPKEFEHLFLLGSAYNHLNQPQEAISLLTSCLTSTSSAAPEVCFEIGRAYFNDDQFDPAKANFEKIQAEQGPLYLISQLYLVRIYLLNKEDVAAEKILNDLSERVKTENPLKTTRSPMGEVATSPHSTFGSLSGIDYEIAFFKGLVRFRSEDFAKAATNFEKAIPLRNAEKAPWYAETLYYLGWSYLKMGDDSLLPFIVQKEYLDKSEGAFLKLAQIQNDERIQLSLGQYYLIRAARLDDKGAYQQAEALLSRPQTESSSQTLLIKAQGASTYTERAQLYKQLTTESPNTLSGWYLRALNDFEEARIQSADGHAEEANKRFESAGNSFREAYDRLKFVDPSKAGLTLIYQAKSLDQQQKTKAALKILNDIPAYIYNQMDEPDEVDFLKGYFASKLHETTLAEDHLNHLLANYPSGRFREEALNLLGILNYKQERFVEALAYLTQLANEHPDSSLTGNALALAANVCDILKQPDKARQFRQKCYEKYPQCSLASEAYFNYYSYRDYLQGDRQALKHLASFPGLFPESPFLLNACYLMGLDQTRDRKTPEGKWIRKKNLTAAIDAFQEVENLYETLKKQTKIPSDRVEYYTALRFRSTLERAQNNLAIADDSLGAKKAIYLEYAEEVLSQMLNDLGQEQQFRSEPYPPLLEECHYWLAQTYLKQENDLAAKKVLEDMLEKYRLAKTTRGYFLSRVWSDLASIHMRENEYGLALKALVQAEDASKGKVLSTDQRLDLWIQQSRSYEGLNQLDQAILILSKVVNDDAVSSLRLKAMYIRAELYEKQERPELARKQLEAIAKKGGEWAQKAKDKLDKDYGYQ